MITAVVILSIICYLTLGIILSNTLFKSVWQDRFYMLFDGETALATGLFWPFILVALVALLVLSLLAKAFGGE